MKEKKNLKKALEGDPIDPFVIACEVYNILNKHLKSEEDLSEIETSTFIDMLLNHTKIGEEINEVARFLIKYKDLFKT